MTTLKAQKRDMKVKAKKLRRDGFTTGVLFGKDMKESMPLQFPSKEALGFIKNNKEGSQVTLVLDDQEIKALVKSIDYNAMQKQIMSMELQTLVAGEKVTSTAQVKLVNEDKVVSIVELELSEIHYKTDPEHLIETVEINLESVTAPKNIFVKDLPISKNTNISLVTSPDALVVHIADHAKNGAIEEDTEEEAVAE